MDVVHRGVGAITESDILLAKASGAIILGFHVRPDSNARAAAEREQVDVRTYRIIYEAVEDVRNALEGLLKPEEREIVLGEAEVLAALQGAARSAPSPAARCGAASSSAPRKARVIRDGVEVYTGALSSLKRFKDDVQRSARGARVRHRRSRTSTTSRSATGSSRSAWKRSSGRSRQRGARGGAAS